MDYGSGIATALTYGILSLFGLVACLFFLLIVMRIVGRRRETSLERRKEAVRPLMQSFLSGSVTVPDVHKMLADTGKGNREATEQVLLEYAISRGDEYRARILELSRSMGFVREDIENVERGGDARCAESAYHLGVVGAREAVPALVDALEERKEPGVVFACLKSLADIGYPEALDSVKAYLETHPGLQNMRLAEMMLQRSAEFAPYVAERLRLGEDDEERLRLLVEVAGAMKTGDLMPEVTRYLSHHDARLRAAAARSLGKMDDGEACRRLAESLSDEDPEVRAETASAMGKAGCGSYVALLRAGLHDNVVEVKRRCAVALTLLGDEGRSALEQGLTDEREESREIAAEVMDYERVRRWWERE